MFFSRRALSTHAFQTETRQLLDMVAKNLYTDREVFLRELISNASDALEKARFLQATKEEQKQAFRPLEVRVEVDKQRRQLVIRDSGIGMSHDELIQNLGTIASSGSRAFAAAEERSEETRNTIIGMFGVGFYSSFMVADKVEVLSRPLDGPDQTTHRWVSAGQGEFSLEPVVNEDEAGPGTTIRLHLKEDAADFLDETKLEGIIKKYSNFVGFPILLNEKPVNTVKALWTSKPGTVSDQEHTDFYRYIANAWDEPLFKMHFHTKVPVPIKALLYVPSAHMEKHGLGLMDPGVGLYSRKVLIQGRSSSVLPQWLRFVKGVVDSESIPLNISRENMQDSALIARIRNTLTKKIIKALADESERHPDKFTAFSEEFGPFIKEGVCTDFYHKKDIARLLRYESSVGRKKELFSLDDYISRMYPEQKGIYYHVAPSRSFALDSPYLESFKARNTEVLLMYQPVDDFVMQNLGEYGKRKIISVESGRAGTEQKGPGADVKLGSEEDDTAALEPLFAFLLEVLSDRVSSVTASSRLVSTPAIVVDHESSTVRKMMQYVDQKASHELPRQKLEINPQHPIMQRLLATHTTQPDVARLVAEQVFDNALIAADILDTPQTMLPRLNKLLETVLKD